MIYALNWPAFKVLLRRFFHCLRPGHDPVTNTAGFEDAESWRVTLIACTCGRSFDPELEGHL